jgi:Ni/Co efflux regulator RcnB
VKITSPNAAVKSKASKTCPRRADEAATKLAAASPTVEAKPAAGPPPAAKVPAAPPATARDHEKMRDALQDAHRELRWARGSVSKAWRRIELEAQNLSVQIYVLRDPSRPEEERRLAARDAKQSLTKLLSGFRRHQHEAREYARSANKSLEWAAHWGRVDDVRGSR